MVITTKTKHAVKEDFIYYVWQFRLVPDGMKTVDGEPIELIHPGVRNNDSGPDFFNARVRIGETLWAGNVEMHLRTSDWERHQHSTDKAYQNVILHVVFQHDTTVTGAPIHTLEIGSYIDLALEAKYQELMAGKGTVPCEAVVNKADTMAVESMLTRVTAHRLEERYHRISQMLNTTSMSWEEAFYQRLLRSFGLRVNADAMEMLARTMPLSVLLRHRDNLMQLEALLFGQSGLLNKTFSDSWPRQLQNEFSFLQRKYSLRPLDESIWRFARLRPPSFPTLRIAQFAGLIHQHDRLFSQLTTVQTVDEALRVLINPASDYWQTHYRFDLQSPEHQSGLGKDQAYLILINAVVPFLFAWGHDRADDGAAEKAISLLSMIPAEKNNEIEFWKTHGITITSAFQSQALLELKRTYCDKRRCLDCQIGHSLLKKN